MKGEGFEREKTEIRTRARTASPHQHFLRLAKTSSLWLSTNPGASGCFHTAQLKEADKSFVSMIVANGVCGPRTSVQASVLMRLVTSSF